MFKAKKRIENLEKKIGGTRHSKLSIAEMKRTARLFDGKIEKDRPECRGYRGMDLETLRKSLKAYSEEAARDLVLEDQLGEDINKAKNA